MTPRVSPRRGFTLMQLLVVVGIMAVLAALWMGVFGRTRLQAQRAQCDTNLKAITMALDAFRQENGHYPDSLNELVEKNYITDSSMLHCPTDPRPVGGYDDYYILRSARDSDELPIVVCPLCQNDGGDGVQAFKGRYTKEFATRPAQIVSATDATVERPGKNPLAARAGMLVRGGDQIRTGAGGDAFLRFADGSTAQINGAGDMTVLESFISGGTRAPLYTILRQDAGNILYHVHHGSKFDVATPTATAGALGTQFRIKQVGDIWYLKVLQSKVYCSDGDDTKIYTPLPSSPGQPDASTLTAGSDDATASLPVVETNSWVPIGESETVIVAPPTQTSPAKVKKKKRRSHRTASETS